MQSTHQKVGYKRKRESLERGENSKKRLVKEKRKKENLYRQS